MLTLTLDRDDQDDIRTLGTIRNAADNSVVVPDTLELPWRDNHKDTSCIPEGTYLCKLKFSPEHGINLYWITDVEGRDDVEIHWGNFPANTKGCVLVGQSREQDAIDHSKDAFGAFMTFLAGVEEFTLVVRSV